MKTHARVVVVGGGVMGVGILYHLTKEGWSDVVLVEKGELTSGSTWHAAGLVPHFIASLNMAKVHYYGSQLYQRLEAETGQATGWHGCGAIRLATNQDEADWFHYVQGVLRCIGAECHLIGPSEIADLHPLLDTDGVVLGAYTPGDGHTDPAGSTMAMAAGARAGGAEIYLRNRVVDIGRRADGNWDVVTEHGTIVAEHVVNAAGGFSPQVGAMVGIDVPIVNIVHQYLVTESLDAVSALDREPPVVRDPRASCYYRQERQGLIIGPYETDGAQPWALDGIDWSFDTELLPPDIDRLVPWLELAAKRIPAFENAGIARVVSGPITHTPDGGFLIGPAPGLPNFWMCCGAGIGITQGPGAGKYLAQWMVHGQTEINVREMETRRFGEWAGSGYCVPKAVDEYHRMYQTHFPGEFREPGRPVKTTPVHGRLAARGAVFAETFGWERAKWFAAPGVEERYSFRRTNWFEPVAEECRAVRERVGVVDLSSFAKFDVTGRDAASVPRPRHRQSRAAARRPYHPRARAHRARRHRVRVHGDPVGREPLLPPFGRRRPDPRPRLAGAAQEPGRGRRGGGRDRRLRRPGVERPALARAAGQADRRRARQRGFSMAVGARDRNRGSPDPGAQGLLRGRARLGASPPDGRHGSAVRRRDGRRRGVRHRRLRPVRPELASHGEGLQGLGAGVDDRDHAGRGRSGPVRRSGQPVHRHGTQWPDVPAGTRAVAWSIFPWTPWTPTPTGTSRSTRTTASWASPPAAPTGTPRARASPSPSSRRTGRGPAPGSKSRSWAAVRRQGARRAAVRSAEPAAERA